MAAELDLDAILGELKTGRFQLRNYGLILLPIIFSAIYNAQYIFNAAVIPHRCLVPECETPPADFTPGSWAAWSLPEGESCRRYTPVSAGGPCTTSGFTNVTEPCGAYVYESHDSIAYAFNLACQDWKLALVGTMHSVGLLAALPLTGYVSDTYGRRTALIITSVSGGVLGVIRAFMPTYYLYLLFEFLEPTFASGVYSTGFILALEMVEADKRVLGGNLISSTFALGQVCLGLLAWAVPYWFTLTLIIYAPSVLFVFYYFWITESVRWLLSKGHKKEAVAIIYKAAEVNKKKLSPQTIKLLDAPPAQNPDGTTEEDTKRSASMMRQVLRSRILLTRLCICSFWWITTTLIYYGLSINSVTLAGNSYVNYILTALVEIPGYALSVLTLDRFGRKRSIITAFAVCGVTLLSMPFLPNQWVSTSATLLGKLAISMAFGSIYIYTAELFPTHCRHQLMGGCSMVGRVGSIAAPFTPLLMAYMEALPYILFGSMAGVAALLMTLTPETLDTVLPDTVAQAENILRRPSPSVAPTPKPKASVVTTTTSPPSLVTMPSEVLLSPSPSTTVASTSEPNPPETSPRDV